jgi:hypothetical protein
MLGFPGVHIQGDGDHVVTVKIEQPQHLVHVHHRAHPSPSISQYWVALCPDIGQTPDLADQPGPG